MPSVRIFFNLHIAPEEQPISYYPIAGIMPGTGHRQADSEWPVER
jgi:hypothetical protein